MYVCTVGHSYNKPEIPGQIVCYKQKFVISEQFPMRYCSTWLRSLLCYIKKFVIEEFVIRVFHCTYIRTCTYARTYSTRTNMGSLIAGRSKHSKQPTHTHVLTLVFHQPPPLIVLWISTALLSLHCVMKVVNQEQSK